MPGGDAFSQVIEFFVFFLVQSPRGDIDQSAIGGNMDGVGHYVTFLVSQQAWGRWPTAGSVSSTDVFRSAVRVVRVPGIKGIG
jgi:hypothetical protein